MHDLCVWIVNGPVRFLHNSPDLHHPRKLLAELDVLAIRRIGIPRAGTRAPSAEEKNDDR
jgi:hypothetical protein